MDQKLLNHIGALKRVSELLKNKFVGKDQLIDLMVVCAIAQEHLLIVGPPGTAKSELVKRFALLCSSQNSSSSNGKTPYFEYLLTRFTEPNEIFGPVNIHDFQEGKGHHRVTDRLLPRAEIAFLDEVFKANSAILNALLTVLNERVYHNGGELETVPLLCAFGATNEVPDDPTLAAIYDRFLVRLWTDNVEESQFGTLIQKGWALETDRIQSGYNMKLANITTSAALRNIHTALEGVDMSTVASEYHEAIRRIRAEGIEVSDRRVIKLLKLIGASAILHKRLEANSGDFWILRHVWNSPEQIPHLQAIIEPYLKGHEGEQWSAERDLSEIDGAIKQLTADKSTLRTDADYTDFLHQAEHLRRELTKHSNDKKSKPMVKSTEKLIEEALKLLEDRG